MSGVQSLPTRENFNVQFKVFHSTAEIPTIHARSIAIFKEMGAPDMDYSIKSEIQRLESIIDHKGQKALFKGGK